MYLSKVILNPNDKGIVWNLTNSNYMHKKVMSAFLDDIEHRRDARKQLGILFRLDINPHEIILYVQSKVEPNWFGKTWVLNAKVKCLDSIVETFKVGRVLNFNLKCTPYYTGEDNKLHSFNSENEKIVWMQKKEKYNGFKLLTCESRRLDERINNIGGNDISLYVTELSGVLEITDVEKFIKFYSDGVGRQKAYGMGMLMLF